VREQASLESKKILGAQHEEGLGNSGSRHPLGKQIGKMQAKADIKIEDNVDQEMGNGDDDEDDVFR